MSYQYLDHEADIGIKAEGKNPKQALEDAAKGMFNLMADIENVGQKQKVDIICHGDDMASLFVELLNEVLTQRDLANLLFSKLKVESLKERENGYELRAKAYGEPIDLDKHQIKAEVKAATYAGLKFEKKPEGYVFQCILDL